MSARDSRVYRFTFLTFVFVAAAVWSLLQCAWTGDYRWACLLAAAGAAQAMLVNRMAQHDRLCEPVFAPVMPRHEEEKQPQEVAYIPKIQSENGNRIRLGKFKLTRQQWQDLGSVIQANENRVVRDVIAQARIFTSLSTKWPQIIREFERLEWVSNGQLTDAGVKWFSQFNTPLPH